MSIPGVECARRRRMYQSRPVDSGLSQLRGARLNSSITEHNRQIPPRDSNYNSSSSHRHRDHHYYSFSLHPRNEPTFAGPSRIIVSRDQHFAEQCSGNSNGIDTCKPRNISQAKDLVASRSPVLNTGSYQNDGHGAAMVARSRLDERLRAAALVSHRRSNVLPLTQVRSAARDSFSEIENNFLNEEVLETRMRDWVAVWAPGLENQHESSGPRNPWCLKPEEGLSKVRIGTLKRENITQRKDKSKGAVSEQEDCPVCLENFSLGQILICLPCKHKFHSGCLTPWLESNGQCPYCRATIFDKVLPKSSSSTVSFNDHVVQSGDVL